jgi:hypothetical protein
MKKSYKLLIWAFCILGIIALIYYSITRPMPTLSQEETDALASCLNQKNISLYGGLGCENCEIQKAMFGNTADSIPYIDCTAQKEACKTDAALPYWKINDKILPGPIPLQVLKSITKC